MFFCKSTIAKNKTHKPNLVVFHFFKESEIWPLIREVTFGEIGFIRRTLLYYSHKS